MSQQFQSRSFMEMVGHDKARLLSRKSRCIWVVRIGIVVQVYSSSLAFCLSFRMKNSSLDCGISVNVSGSKKTGFGPLAAFLSRLEKTFSLGSWMRGIV